MNTLEVIKCPHCEGRAIKDKRGIGTSAEHWHFKCDDCEAIWTEPIESTERDESLAAFAKEYPPLAFWINQASEIINTQGEAIKELFVLVVKMYHALSMDIPEQSEIRKLVDGLHAINAVIDSIEEEVTTEPSDQEDV